MNDTREDGTPIYVNTEKVQLCGLRRRWQEAHGSRLARLTDVEAAWILRHLGARLHTSQGGRDPWIQVPLYRTEQMLQAHAAFRAVEPWVAAAQSRVSFA